MPRLRATVIDEAGVARTPEEWWAALGREAPIREIGLADIRKIIGSEEAAALRRWRSAQVRE